jgi:hypothetical protein
MSDITLDWKSIRPLNGSRDKGFEELCSQLARAEVPQGSEFIRKGTPDAGVECYAILSNGTEWAWQAKYFDGFGSSQGQQLDKSVKTAIEKHPKMVRYFVCIPLDLPDARVDNQKSAKMRWNELVTKWISWASDKDMTVEFIYWGSHELLDRLNLQQHSGRLQFWFDVRRFDKDWFSARLDEAIQTAGPRYTPEIHVDLPIAAEFESFGRTERFFNTTKALARTVREELRRFEHSNLSVIDSEFKLKTDIVISKVQKVLSEFSTITFQPTGFLPFKAIREYIDMAKDSVEELSDFIIEQMQKPDELRTHKKLLSQNKSLDEYWRQLLNLSHELMKVGETIDHAEKLAGGSLLILCGDAGTGKTHLLCDVARQRTDSDYPTVLLMGQQFISTDAPWSQALQKLDLADLSMENFVGALESIAQLFNSRALIMIDAVNEGAGRTIWPDHLAAFLAYIKRSPWIGVVLAIRSSYENLVIPTEVYRSATIVRHQGFTNNEYDAARTFFLHYELELPSTPLLTPEFHNPLFLKTLCQGLNAQGEKRLPRGFHGITSVFNCYLKAINNRLSSSLDYDFREQLVQKALEAIANTFLESRESWLSLSNAKEIVNALLPGRSYEKSLYRCLVTEGILVEESSLHHSKNSEEIVFISYERFADHLRVKILLDKHLDTRNPAAAFTPGNSLAFIHDQYISPGLLEAFCIQVPERIGQELFDVALINLNYWGLGDAFRKSIIWRNHKAFSDSTSEAFNKFCKDDDNLYDTLNVLITVTTLPEHPFNALFLDQQLRKYNMPDRDAWWSIALHYAWNSDGAVDRLVDWASALRSDMSINDETIELCAITLTWLFTTSNRCLRDRATKALVNLLTGRFKAVIHLVERFADVDDLYVAERIYAVAYGTAMRCHDPVVVGSLAKCVYDHVFAVDNTPQHILLRDYARGVVERAIHLGSILDIVVDKIRPPYKSQWPKIPTEEDIKNEFEGARSYIYRSVMEKDFAHYVIGTNSSTKSIDWLSLTLNEPPWNSALQLKEQLLTELSNSEQEKWNLFIEAESALDEAICLNSWNSDIPENVDVTDLETQRRKAINRLDKKQKKAFKAFIASLTKDHAVRFSEIVVLECSNERPPGFDLSQIQRYILWRVLELGWTIERFKFFDSSHLNKGLRERSKVERIGKKYQWIAYHEIMALVADHFQYRAQFRGSYGDRVYEGPWQIYLRDIDPSFTLSDIRGGNSLECHMTPWWASIQYNQWGDSDNSQDWALGYSDFPKIEDLLIATNPKDGLRWLNGHGYFHWRQRSPADQDSSDVERKEIWCTCGGYLIQKQDIQQFLEWSEGVDFWGRWMPDVVSIHKMFLGEHSWSQASRYFQQPYYGDDGWIEPSHDCPVKVRTIAFKYSHESGTDCSTEESYQIHLPVSELVTGLGIRWNGTEASFVDNKGQVVVQDPTVNDNTDALLIREDVLQEFLTRENLAVCWVLLGEKQIIPPFNSKNPYPSALRMSGAYVFSEGSLTGFIKYMLNEQDGKSELPVIHTDRIPRS